MRIVLVHWHEAEAHERAERLRAVGFFVDVHWQQHDGKALRAVPVVFVPGEPAKTARARARAFGLEHGVVDTKVCAIDAVWSGLRFSHRRAAR